MFLVVSCPTLGQTWYRRATLDTNQALQIKINIILYLICMTSLFTINLMKHVRIAQLCYYKQRLPRKNAQCLQTRCENIHFCARKMLNVELNFIVVWFRVDQWRDVSIGVWLDVLRWQNIYWTNSTNPRWPTDAILNYKKNYTENDWESWGMDAKHLQATFLKKNQLLRFFSFEI